MVRKEKRMDHRETTIISSVILLCVFGLIILYSASAFKCMNSKKYNYDSVFLLKSQVKFICFGFVAIIICRYIDYTKVIIPLSWAVYWAAIILILLLRVNGVNVNGATRWLSLPGGVSFQVCEVVKVAVILALCKYISDHSNSLTRPALTIRLWLIGGFPAVLVFFISSDFSSAVVILGITFLISLVMTRTPKTHLAALLMVIILVAAYVLKIALDMPSVAEIEDLAFRDRRIAVFLGPERYAENRGYQTTQALYALGSGGWFGRGLGKSLQKYILPEAETDMIFCVLAEETGVFGVWLMVCLEGYILLQIIKTARESETIYGSVLGLGIFSHIGIQSFFNIAVCQNLLPNTGLPLPFFSYGGSSMTILLFEIGMVISIHRHHIVKRKCRSRHSPNQQRIMKKAYPDSHDPGIRKDA